MITFENNDLFKCQSNTSRKFFSGKRQNRERAKNKNNEGVKQQ